MYSFWCRFKCLIIGLFLLISPIALLGQNDDVSVSYHQAPNASNEASKKTSAYKKDLILEKIAVGGTFGLSFGRFIHIGLHPDISYHFNEWVSVGVGGTYIFAHDNSSKQSDNMFGLRAFAEGHLLNILGVHVAYEAMNLKDYSPMAMVNDRIWANNLSFGGGAYKRTGRFSYYVYFLYIHSDRPEYFINYSFKTGFNIFLK